jgi:hypothetical protein
MSFMSVSVTSSHVGYLVCIPWSRSCQPSQKRPWKVQENLLDLLADIFM